MGFDTLTVQQLHRVVRNARRHHGTRLDHNRARCRRMWDYLPYRSGPTVSFQEATMYLSDLDDTSDIVENRGNEYFEPYRED